MNAIALCGLLAESLKKIERLKEGLTQPASFLEETDNAKEMQEDPDPAVSAAAAVLEEMYVYAELIQDIGHQGSSCERSGLYYLCAAAVRILSTEVYEITRDIADRASAKRMNSEAMKLAEKTGRICDEGGRGCSEATLFGISAAKL